MKPTDPSQMMMEAFLSFFLKSFLELGLLLFHFCFKALSAVYMRFKEPDKMPVFGNECLLCH
jgi:hypothetical protein